MRSIYNKKTLCLLLCATLLNPALSLAKGRDIVMGVTGALVVAGGVTFIIKSGNKKPAQPQTAGILLQPWFPMKDLQSHDFKKLP